MIDSIVELYFKEHERKKEDVLNLKELVVNKVRSEYDFCSWYCDFSARKVDGRCRLYLQVHGLNNNAEILKEIETDEKYEKYCIVFNTESKKWYTIGTSESSIFKDIIGRKYYSTQREANSVMDKLNESMEFPSKEIKHDREYSQCFKNMRHDVYKCNIVKKYNGEWMAFEGRGFICYGDKFYSYGDSEKIARILNNSDNHKDKIKKISYDTEMLMNTSGEELIKRRDELLQEYLDSISVGIGLHMKPFKVYLEEEKNTKESILFAEIMLLTKDQEGMSGVVDIIEKMRRRFMEVLTNQIEEQEEEKKNDNR